MEAVQTLPPTVDLTALDAKLDLIQQQLEQVVDRQRYQSELIDEMWPIMNEVVKASTETLNDLEKKGYFAFARQGMSLVERIVENYSEDDVRQLSDSIVGILDTVRNVTQPEVLAVANETTEALHNTDTVNPIGVFGMLKASRDRDVKYGTAVVLEVLRQIGRGGRKAAATASPADKRRHRLERRLGPSGQPRRSAPSRPAAPRSSRPTPAPAPSAAAPTPAAPAPVVDPASWTREIGIEIAASEGIELTDAHWNVLDFARKEFLEKGVSPNIRKITTGLDVTTKDIYQLFPKAPARAVCKIAGIPKPAGCL